MPFRFLHLFALQYNLLSAQSHVWLPDRHRLPAVFRQILDDVTHPVDITWEPVSAGTGNYLEDSVKETYDVGHLAPEQTDFGVRISGDSMEPLYHTGDVAWIQKKDSLANGEIGIFYLNGNTYIKELHDEPDGVYLISLNQKYRPIQVLESDSFKIFGKVIGKCKGAEIPGFH